MATIDFPAMTSPSAPPLDGAETDDFALFPIFPGEEPDDDDVPLDEAAPPADDFPVGCTVTFADPERCRRLMGLRYAPWMVDLFTYGAQAQIVRHCGRTYSYVKAKCLAFGSDGPRPWPQPDDDPPSPDDVVVLAATVHRACCRVAVGGRRGHGVSEPVASARSQACLSPNVPSLGGAMTAFPSSAILSVANGSSHNNSCVNAPADSRASISSHSSARFLPGSDGNGHDLRKVAPESDAAVLSVRRECAVLREEGNQCFQKRKVEDAIKSYGRGIDAGELALKNYALDLELSADIARLYCNRSGAHHHLKQYGRAFEDAERAVALAPSSFRGYLRAGHALRGEGKFDVAGTWYEKAATIEPHEKVIGQVRANSNALFLADRAPHSVRIVVDEDTATVTAATACPSSDVIFSEVPLAAVHDSVAGDAEHICAHCTAAALDRTALSQVLPPVAMQLVDHRGLCNFTPVSCTRQCGDFYCSKACRDAAWQQYHCLECTGSGKWRAGMVMVRDALSRKAVCCDPDIIRAFDESMSRPRSDDSLSPTQSRTSAGNEHNIDGTLIPFLRLAVRIFARIACLHPDNETSRVRALRFIETLASDRQPGINSTAPPLLTASQRRSVAAVWGQLALGLDSFERSVLSRERFFDVVRAMQRHALRVSTSPVVGLLDVFQMHIGLLRERTDPKERSKDNGVAAKLRDLELACDVLRRHPTRRSTQGLLFLVIGSCIRPAVHGSGAPARGAGHVKRSRRGLVKLDTTLANMTDNIRIVAGPHDIASGNVLYLETTAF